MTRARALKHAIRTRAARTGERYTAARRHVLAGLTPVSAPAQKPSAPAAPPSRATRTGTISEAKITERTGHGFDHWFGVLDQFGAVKQGHTAAARHLHEAHGVDGWYAQSITVAYERARGVRAMNQRCDGGFEVSVSKTIAGDVPGILRVLTDPRQRARLKAPDPGLIAALAAAVAGGKSKGVVVRPDGMGRLRYAWGATTVQFYLVPKGSKVQVVVTNMKLASNEMVEDRRGAWRVMLQSLAAIV